MEDDRYRVPPGRRLIVSRDDDFSTCLDSKTVASEETKGVALMPAGRAIMPHDRELIVSRDDDFSTCLDSKTVGSKNTARSGEVFQGHESKPKAALRPSSGATEEGRGRIPPGQSLVISRDDNFSACLDTDTAPSKGRAASQGGLDYFSNERTAKPLSKSKSKAMPEMDPATEPPHPGQGVRESLNLQQHREMTRAGKHKATQGKSGILPFSGPPRDDYYPDEEVEVTRPSTYDQAAPHASEMDNVGAFDVSGHERSTMYGPSTVPPGQADDPTAFTAHIVGDNNNRDERLRNHFRSLAANAPVVEGRTEHNTGGKEPSCRHRKALWIAIPLLLVAIIIGTVAGVLSRGEDQPSNPTKTEGEPQHSPLLAPSDRIKRIAESISGADALNFIDSYYTPQIMARDWLLYYDRYSPITPPTDAEIAQRYILAVLFFALGGESWIESRKWLGETSECDGWYGVSCDHHPQSSARLVSKLHLELNGLAGIFPEELIHLPMLQVLDLHASREDGLATGDISGTIPSKIGALTSLEILDLGNNQVSGSLPKSMMSLTNLTKLELSGNPLSGTIPTDIGKLTSLEELGIGWLVDSSGGLTGTIPPSLGRLGSLKWLQIAYNRLTGTLPSQIGLLTNLENLFVYWNEISGTIPPSIGNLRNVGKMALCCNELSGTIPTNFGDLTKLEVLKFHDNNLEGIMPQEVCALKEDHILSALTSDCDTVNPELVCSCCDECFETP